VEKVVARYAALLALSEVAFGSFLHALNVPLAGHALSLNQGVLLTLASRPAKGRLAAASSANRISLVAALFKALSPAGKRLTPMLAISVQGSLYAVGLVTFGTNVAGVSLAMVLLGLWGFVQPVLVAYLLFGKALFSGLQKTWLEVAALLSLPEQLEWWILSGVVLAKVLLGVALAVLAWKQPEFEARYEEKIREWGERFPSLMARPADSRPKWRLVLRDLTTTWFLLALAFQALFFFYSGDRDAAAVWTYLLRPIALGAIFFWATRSIPKSFWERLLPS